MADDPSDRRRRLQTALEAIKDSGNAMMIESLKAAIEGRQANLNLPELPDGIASLIHLSFEKGFEGFGIDPLDLAQITGQHVALAMGDVNLPCSGLTHRLNQSSPVGVITEHEAPLVTSATPGHRTAIQPEAKPVCGERKRRIQLERWAGRCQHQASGQVVRSRQITDRSAGCHRYNRIPVVTGDGFNGTVQQHLPPQRQWR